MKSTTLTAVLLVLINLCLAPDPLAQEHGELVFATLLYRHGDRAITEFSYPNDPYKNTSFWPMGYGQLTNQGKERHFEFGKWLRNRYSELLPLEYSSNDIYIRSTSVDRALMSAAVNLAGLYAPNKEQQWNENLGKLWQPIPIHSIPRELDPSLSFGQNCPRFEKELKKLNSLPEIQKFNNDHQELYDYLKNNSGYSFNNCIMDSNMLYDVLLVETQFNYTLPSWTKSVFPDKLREIAELSFVLPSYNQILKRLSSGALLNEIVEHMKHKQIGKLSPDVKLWVYSAHDSNVASLLNSLNIYNYLLPPYASSVIIELRKSHDVNSTHVVTVSYRNSSTHEPFLFQVPGCDSVACDLDQFIDVLKPILLVDWYRECHEDAEENVKIYFGIISVLLLTVSIISFTFYKKYFVCYCGRNYQKF